MVVQLSGQEGSHVLPHFELLLMSSDRPSKMDILFLFNMKVYRY
jgi:hypothetical protein